LVSNVGLYEIVSKNKNTEAPEKNISLCDDINPKTPMIIETMTSVMGQGVQIGSDTRKEAEYWPNEIKVDGSDFKSKQSVPVESGKTRTISASFDLVPAHWTAIM